VDGGASRVASSYAGVMAIENVEDDDLVLIHDVARPFVSSAVIDRACEIMNFYQAASAVVPSSDTIYILNEQNEIEIVPPRKNLCNVQTPQVFHYGIIKNAHQLAKQDENLIFTDDSSMVHYFQLAKVGTFEGEITNKKITEKSDL
jgi:2-C-methyl-D-erythritol 4-phosphate cytidylyltransferase/2-C-methyl-D-erythritol 2,4-cyclodiphosphate synthase